MSSNQNNSNQRNVDDSINLNQYIFRIISFWPTIVLSVFVFLAVAFLFNRYATKRYQAKAIVLIGDDSKSNGIANIVRAF
ncbi:MAG: Wzz/FepE/Etk N-terminal domain-containing protein, partial [Owenweeksia sp.]